MSTWRVLMSVALCARRMFCQATGFGGTVQEGRSVEDKLRAREANRWGGPPAHGPPCEPGRQPGCM